MVVSRPALVHQRASQDSEPLPVLLPIGQANIKSGRPPARARGGRDCKMHAAWEVLVQFAMTSPFAGVTEVDAKTL